MSSSTLGGAEAMALCTMLMEVVMVLFNPDVCLNPAIPAAERIIEECPTVAEVVIANPVECALLFGVCWHKLPADCRQFRNCGREGLLRLPSALFTEHFRRSNPFSKSGFQCVH